MIRGGGGERGCGVMVLVLVLVVAFTANS